MPILSYLAHPVDGRAGELRRDLESLPGCSVVAAESGSLLVLVTDTETDDEDERLRERLKTVPSLAFLSLVFAHSAGAS